MSRRPCSLLLLLLLLPGLARAEDRLTYRVKEGDTILRLGWKYSVNPDAIRRLNHLASDDLPVGREIILPVFTPRAEEPSRPAPAPEPAIRKAEPVPTPNPVEREVEPLAAPVLAPPLRLQPEFVPASDLKSRLLGAARNLAAHHIGYNEPWTPPGQRTPWRMDCSNTARYLYETAAGIDLGRTASDQYEFLRRHGRAWDVPMDGPLADIGKLQRLLKAGDLLFWENTYRPERHSTITHVMIFLGEDANGRWIMAGSRGHRAGGPDIYPFDPHQPAGGYSVFFGLIHHTGRFIAYGRPIS